MGGGGVEGKTSMKIISLHQKGNYWFAEMCIIQLRITYSTKYLFHKKIKFSKMFLSICRKNSFSSIKDLVCHKYQAGMVLSMFSSKKDYAMELIILVCVS